MDTALQVIPASPGHYLVTAHADGDVEYEAIYAWVVSRSDPSIDDGARREQATFRAIPVTGSFESTHDGHSGILAPDGSVERGVWLDRYPTLDAFVAGMRGLMALSEELRATAKRPAVTAEKD